MSQQNKLLFLGVCCYVLQAISCAQIGNVQSFSFGSKSPQLGTFKPNFLSSRGLSFSGTTYDKAQPSEVLSAPPRIGLPILRFNRSISKLENESNVKPEQQIPAQNELPVLVQPVVKNEPRITDENLESEEESQSTEPEAKSSKKKSKKRKNAKTADLESSNRRVQNRSLSVQDDPLYIPDRETLIERAKDMIRNLIRDRNGNRAVTRLVLNARYLLENKVTSDIIKTHTELIKNTLMNEEAKKIIEDTELRIAEAFMKEKAPEKSKYAFSKLLQYLTNKDLPNFYKDRFGHLKNLINCKQTQYALKTFKNGFVKFMNSKDSLNTIEKAFDKFDKLLSLDFTISSLIKLRNQK